MTTSLQEPFTGLVAALMTILRTKGRRYQFLSRDFGGASQKEIAQTLLQLEADHWAIKSGDGTWSAKTRRSHRAAQLQASADAATGERSLEELLLLPQGEREALALLLASAREASDAAWTTDGNAKIRDADEPRAV